MGSIEVCRLKHDTCACRVDWHWQSKCSHVGLVRYEGFDGSELGDKRDRRQTGARMVEDSQRVAGVLWSIEGVKGIVKYDDTSPKAC